jgi:uncharacterized membrane protein
MVARNFVKGLIVLTPITITAVVVYHVVVWMDGLLPLPKNEDGSPRIPGLGLVATLAAITVIGWVATHVVGRQVFAELERILLRLPFVNLIYTSIKDMIHAFVGDKKAFNHPVAVTLTPDGAVKAMGFLTLERMDAPGLEDHVGVYFPQAYGWAGQLLLVPRDRVTPVQCASTDLMAFVLSGGISGQRTVVSDALAGRLTPPLTSPLTPPLTSPPVTGGPAARPPDTTTGTA